MGCDTKGVIATSCKDAMLVLSLVESSLNHLIMGAYRKAHPGRSFMSAEARKEFRTVKIELTPTSGMACLFFTYKGEKRQMNLFMTCDCDNVDIAPLSISMSLGCWGNSDLYMKTVLHALSIFGPAYFEHNDCGSVGKKILCEDPLTVAEALKLGYIQPFVAETLVEMFDKGDKSFPPNTFSAFFGAPEALVRSILKTEPCTDRWKEMDALADSFAKPDTAFIVEESTA